MSNVLKSFLEFLLRGGLVVILHANGVPGMNQTKYLALGYLSCIYLNETIACVYYTKQNRLFQMDVSFYLSFGLSLEYSKITP